MSGEGELAFRSRSVDLGTVCWNTLGDSRTEDTAVVAAAASGGPAICGGTTEQQSLRTVAGAGVQVHTRDM